MTSFLLSDEDKETANEAFAVIIYEAHDAQGEMNSTCNIRYEQTDYEEETQWKDMPWSVSAVVRDEVASEEEKDSGETEEGRGR